MRPLSSIKTFDILSSIVYSLGIERKKAHRKCFCSVAIIVLRPTATSRLRIPLKLCAGGLGGKVYISITSEIEQNFLISSFLKQKVIKRVGRWFSLLVGLLLAWLVENTKVVHSLRRIGPRIPFRACCAALHGVHRWSHCWLVLASAFAKRV